jgi:hypothetical protein
MIIEGTLRACQHDIKWWFNVEDLEDTPKLRKQLEEEAEQRARACLKDDYAVGELCSVINEKEVRGWWNIK